MDYHLRRIVQKLKKKITQDFLLQKIKLDIKIKKTISFSLKSLFTKETLFSNDFPWMKG